MDYVQTFVEEVGQEDGPEAEAFSMELQEKLENQDRTEEIVLKNNHRPLTQNTATKSKKNRDTQIKSIDQESSTEFQPNHTSEIATEIEDMEI